MAEGVRPGDESAPTSRGILLSADLLPLSAVSEGTEPEGSDDKESETDEDEWSEKDSWEDEGP